MPNDKRKKQSKPKTEQGKKALGKGLGALLGDAVKTTSLRPQHMSIIDISIDNIEANPYQPRKNFEQKSLEELSKSIKLQGIIQPITVRKITQDKYQLIAGERRLQASIKAELKTIPAFVRTANDQQMLEMALIENIQRENLNALEIALSYQRLINECSLKQEELGDRVGKNRATVTNYLRLLKLPLIIQAGIKDNKITMGHARALISLENIDMQINIYNNIVSKHLNVRQVEELVRNLQKEDGKQKIPYAKKEEKKANPELKQMQNKLSSHFGTKVQIIGRDKKGEIKIPYFSPQDLNRILEIINL